MKHPLMDFMIKELCEARELIRKDDMFFEDLGGHIVDESYVPLYFEEYIKHLTSEERMNVLARASYTAGGGDEAH